MRRRPLLRLLLTLAAAALLVPAVPAATERKRSADGIEVGDTLPDFFVRLTDGNGLHSRDLRRNTAVLVFFHTSCGDCRRELPEIDALQREAPRGVRFLCISRADSLHRVREFWNSRGLTLPVAAEPTRRIYCLFARNVIPRIYVCAPGGRITAAYARKAGRRSLLRAIRKANKTFQP